MIQKTFIELLCTFMQQEKVKHNDAIDANRDAMVAATKAFQFNTARKNLSRAMECAAVTGATQGELGAQYLLLDADEAHVCQDPVKSSEVAQNLLNQINNDPSSLSAYGVVAARACYDVATSSTQKILVTCGFHVVRNLATSG